MSGDDGTKPWDAPDPSQLRITTAPAARRSRKGAARQGEANGPAVSPPPPPRLRPPGAAASGDPAEAPPRPVVRPPRRPNARVGRPTGEFVPEAAEAPPPPPSAAASSDPVAVDAPPVPRPHYPFGAPLPARIDTKAGVPRLQVGPGADWRDIDEPEPVAGAEAALSVSRTAIAAGSVLGGAGFLISGLAVGVVVGANFVNALTPKPDPLDTVVEAPPPPPELVLPAFPGGKMNVLTGTDALVATYPAQRQLPPPIVYVEVSLPEQSWLDGTEGSEEDGDGGAEASDADLPVSPGSAPSPSPE